ncbi:uncharacterized protein G2W53_039583 [Senna tora]|uniref:Uncharacterized protein n=1 Tax=Senna tora TaxID=362788 RepID=A0A834STK5_9FABA|nr:uncharacterized protein G2W53_039583 [Senna tora]
MAHAFSGKHATAIYGREVATCVPWGRDLFRRGSQPILPKCFG